MADNEEKCVHTEHCCAIHGCKYGDESCPVVTGQKTQSFECEDCVYDRRRAKDLMHRWLTEPGFRALCLPSMVEVTMLEEVVKSRKQEFIEG